MTGARAESLRILITGGTSGIGAAVADAALAAGHRVFVTGRNPERLARFLAERHGTGRVRGVRAEAASISDTDAAVARACDEFGGLDVIAPNAGFSARGDLEHGDPEVWRDMVLTNVLGPALLVRAALPALRESAGQIVLTGSTAGRKVFAGNLYTATKWAITGYAESLRMQLAGSGVRVGVLSPGQVRTPLWEDPPSEWMEPAAVAEAFLWMLSRPRDLEINEIIMRAGGQEF